MQWQRCALARPCQVLRVFNSVIRRSVSSYLQVRGSVPVLWTQAVDMKCVFRAPLSRSSLTRTSYDPKIALDKSAQSTAAYRAHFEEQKRIYGKQTVISLLRLTGAEAQLAQTHQQLCVSGAKCVLRASPTDARGVGREQHGRRGALRSF